MLWQGPWLAMCEKYNVEAPRHHPSLESSLNVFQPGLGSGVLETTAQDLGGARQFKRIAKVIQTNCAGETSFFRSQMPLMP